MNYGYICFAYSKNELIAKGIAWATKSKWSHSFITIPSILGKEMALEAGGGGIEIVTFDQGYRNNPNQQYEVYKFKYNQSLIDNSISSCLNELETPYGYLEYIWFIWRCLNKLFNRDIKSQNNWIQKGTVCSGLCRKFLTWCGLGDLFKDFGIDSANAQDLYEIVLSSPDLFELIEKKD